MNSLSQTRCCVCIYVFICIHVYVYVYMFICLYVYMYMCICFCICVCVFIYMPYLVSLLTLCPQACTILRICLNLPSWITMRNALSPDLSTRTGGNVATRPLERTSIVDHQAILLNLKRRESVCVCERELLPRQMGTPDINFAMRSSVTARLISTSYSFSYPNWLFISGLTIEPSLVNSRSPSESLSSLLHF